MDALEKRQKIKELEKEIDSHRREINEYEQQIREKRRKIGRLNASLIEYPE